MILKPNPVAIAQLHYDHGTRAFSGEISSTHGLGRVYDDAADEGLTVIGVTGREIVFVVTHTHYDAEGDLTHWNLRSVVGDYTMVLFND